MDVRRNHARYLINLFRGCLAQDMAIQPTPLLLLLLDQHICEFEEHRWNI